MRYKFLFIDQLGLWTTISFEWLTANCPSNWCAPTVNLDVGNHVFPLLFTRLDGICCRCMLLNFFYYKKISLLIEITSKFDGKIEELVYQIFQPRTGIRQKVFRLKTLPQCVLFSVFPASLWNISLYWCFSVTRFDYNGV